MSLFLYASGSPFEDVLNDYMISGRGVNPFNPKGAAGGGLGGMGTRGNVSGNGSGVRMGMQELSGAVVSAVSGVI